MTSQNVIEFLERKKKRAHPCDAEYYDRAISALQEHIDRENNDPLTFEELREMDGEPAGKARVQQNQALQAREAVLMGGYADGKRTA